MTSLISKTIFVVLNILTFVLCVHLQFSRSGINGKSLEVQLDKTHYKMGEPIYADFKVTFDSSEKAPKVSQATVVTITRNNTKKEFLGLTTHATTGAPQSLPNNKPELFLSPGIVVSQGASYESEVTKLQEFSLVESTEEINRVVEFFPYPGTYQMQFELGGLKSDEIEVNIDQPEGKDKAAYSILRKFDEPLSFDWVWKRNDGQLLLERFVAEYGDTVYGESATRYLAYLYQAKNELDKAQSEFEKIQFSAHKPIADAALQALAEIKRLKGLSSTNGKPS
jgi:hypothetical protein